MLIVCVIATTIVFAGGTYNVQSAIVIQYEATEIQGGASACYTVNGTTTNMTSDGTSSGATKLSFSATDSTTTQYLKPQVTSFTLVENQPIVFKYTFYNEGEDFYATLTNGFASQSAIAVSYSTDNSTYTSTIFKDVTITGGQGIEAQTTLYIKVEIGSLDNDVSCTGSFTWKLSRKQSS